MPRRPAAIQEARPTVRLKNEDGTYKETQEVIDFEASGGSLSDLLDDEKYICSNRRRKTKYSWSAFSSPGTGFTINSTILKDSFLWNPGPPNARPPTVPFSSRTPTRLQKVFNLVARACKIEGGEIGDITREFRDDLGMSSSDTTVESDIKGLYVGISASECLPVVLFKGASKNTVGRDDFSLGVDWDGNLGDREIIWLQNMLIPGNIQYLKSAIDNKITDQEKKQFLQIMKRENRLLETGLNPAGVADTPFQRVRSAEALDMSTYPRGPRLRHPAFQIAVASNGCIGVSFRNDRRNGGFLVPTPPRQCAIEHCTGCNDYLY
ncbi:hypothetical protein FPSE_03455 [Fusarium pseudograminearum CS3096]|uniref:Uncharacterized protein n=1 Tax=Fusarium pseudograminearum (strain CS3096) TaxID=1028729 RepID=K3VMS8_FUSPC|nr:hypothetical protein FPSE_03455 [Fusarium pseudograminearum CS3096]EKJ76372.1 hypothetical protein FPSE_03455 [Fusarium pseudograminearum CS3096]